MPYFCKMSGAQPFLMYADDDEDDLDLLLTTLRHLDSQAKVLTATTGQALFGLLEAIPWGKRMPSAIILDYNMPGWNGMRTLEVLKASETYREIPVFIFTTSDHSRLRQQALALGAANLISKPFHTEDLLEVGRTFLAHMSLPGLYKH